MRFIDWRDLPYCIKDIVVKYVSSTYIPAIRNIWHDVEFEEGYDMSCMTMLDIYSMSDHQHRFGITIDECKFILEISGYKFVIED